MIPLVLLALVGTTLIIVRGTIFDAVRRLWPSFLACSMCCGFWVGAVAGATGILSIGHGRALDMFIAGASTSFSSLLADAVLLKLLGDPSEEKSS